MRRALQKYIEDPLSEALIQGTLPRPSELEVYLGENGIFCRPAKALVPETVGAGGVIEEEPAAPTPGTPLYMF